MVTIERTLSPVFVGCTEPKANCTVDGRQAASYKLQRGRVRYQADCPVAAIRFTVTALVLKFRLSFGRKSGRIEPSVLTLLRSFTLSLSLSRKGRGDPIESASQG